MLLSIPTSILVIPFYSILFYSIPSGGGGDRIVREKTPGTDPEEIGPIFWDLSPLDDFANQDGQELSSFLDFSFPT